MTSGDANLTSSTDVCQLIATLFPAFGDVNCKLPNHHTPGVVRRAGSN